VVEVDRGLEADPVGIGEPKLRDIVAGVLGPGERRRAGERDRPLAGVGARGDERGHVLDRRVAPAPGGAGGRGGSLDRQRQPQKRLVAPPQAGIGDVLKLPGRGFRGEEPLVFGPVPREPALAPDIRVLGHDRPEPVDVVFQPVEFVSQPFDGAVGSRRGRHAVSRLGRRGEAAKQPFEHLSGPRGGSRRTGAESDHQQGGRAVARLAQPRQPPGAICATTNGGGGANRSTLDPPSGAIRSTLGPRSGAIRSSAEGL
jgi:hypothetical protein